MDKTGIAVDLIDSGSQYFPKPASPSHQSISSFSAMTDAFTVVRQNADTVARLHLQIESIRDQIESLNKMTAAALAPLVYQCYATWQPQVGDAAYYFEAMQCRYFEVVVRERNASYVRTQCTAPNHKAFYSFTLDGGADEHTTPCFIVPPALFATLRDALGLQYMFSS